MSMGRAELRCQTLKKEERKKWVTLNVDVLIAIKDADAIAVWVRLWSCPDGWKIYDSWLKKELNLGDVRLKKAKRRLRGLGLWVQTRRKDEKTGKFMGSEVLLREEIITEPSENPQVEKAPPVEK